MELKQLEQAATEAFSQDNFQRAIALYKKCIEVAPDDVNYYWNLGLSLLLAGEETEAQDVWMSVILEVQLSSDEEKSKEYNYQLSQLLKNEAQKRDERGHLRQSVTLYKAILDLFGEDEKIHYHLGHILSALGEKQEAISYLEKATNLNPNLIEAWKTLGDLSIGLGKTAKAIPYYEKAKELGLQDVKMLKELGLALEIEGEYQKAVTTYKTALAINSDDAGTQFRFATALPVIPQSKSEIENARDRCQNQIHELLQASITLQNPMEEVKKTTFFLAYHGKLNVNLQQQVSHLYEKACPSLIWTAPHCQNYPRKSHTKKLKIGFFSKYFRHHTIAKLNRGLIANLSRENFSVIVFSVPQKRDPYREFIQNQADQFITIEEDLATARQAIAEQELDILFYPEIGMDLFTFLLAFSRLAPVQCVTWGHPMTTGINNIDYFFSSVALEPENAQKNYTEELICLQNLSPYYYPLSLPESLQKQRRELGLPEANHLYVCPQSLFKLHPDFDLILAEILEADSLGNIVLLNGGKENYSNLLRQRFQQTISEVIDRIIILPRLSEADFLNLVLQADVMLDPIYFGGGNTTYEALGLGTPVVTLPGNHLRSRISYACYRQMEFLDCIAETTEEYINLALKLGTNPDYRQAISQKILAKNYKLFQNQDAMQEMEAKLYEIGHYSRIKD